MAFLAAIPSYVWTIVILATVSTTARLIHVGLFEKHFKLTFTDAPARSFLYFAAWSVVIWALFPSTVASLFAHLNAADYTLLAFVLLVIYPAAVHVARKQDGPVDWLFALSPDQGMLTLGERFILSKAGDVFFQQLMVGVLIFTLEAAGVAYPTIVGIFVVLFGLAHLYLFFSSSAFWGIYYTTYAALGGVAFTFLYTFVPDAIAYALLLHMLFYVLSGMLFAKLPRPSRAVYRDFSGVTPE